VNSRTLGKLLSASCLCVALTGYASSHDNVEDAVSLGNNTYSIKVEAKNALHRDVDKLRTEANEAAASYCAEHGKELRVISMKDKVPIFGMGYAHATITFKALSPGDPELTAAPQPAPAAGGPVYAAAPQPAPAGPVYIAAPVAPVERHLTTDDLYTELVKLDDLRKKGILTDDEFQAEKKKLLNHSN